MILNAFELTSPTLTYDSLISDSHISDSSILMSKPYILPPEDLDSIGYCLFSQFRGVRAYIGFKDDDVYIRGLCRRSGMDFWWVKGTMIDKKIYIDPDVCLGMYWDNSTLEAPCLIGMCTYDLSTHSYNNKYGWVTEYSYTFYKDNIVFEYDPSTRIISNPEKRFLVGQKNIWIGEITRRLFGTLLLPVSQGMVYTRTYLRNMKKKNL